MTIDELAGGGELWESYANGWWFGTSYYYGDSYYGGSCSGDSWSYASWASASWYGTQYCGESVSDNDEDQP